MKTKLSKPKSICLSSIVVQICRSCSKYLITRDWCLCLCLFGPPSSATMTTISDQAETGNTRMRNVNGADAGPVDFELTGQGPPSETLQSPRFSRGKHDTESLGRGPQKSSFRVEICISGVPYVGSLEILKRTLSRVVPPAWQKLIATFLISIHISTPQGLVWQCRTSKDK